jgi:hypothetical protein
MVVRLSSMPVGIKKEAASFLLASGRNPKTKKATISDCLFFVGSTGEMSNQIWDDLVKIYQVANKLKL